jgi:hypothetical protein
MPTIQLEGVEEVFEFPEGTSQEVMTRSINNFLSTSEAKGSVLDQAPTTKNIIDELKRVVLSKSGQKTSVKAAQSLVGLVVPETRKLQTEEILTSDIGQSALRPVQTLLELGLPQTRARKIEELIEKGKSKKNVVKEVSKELKRVVLNKKQLPKLITTGQIAAGIVFPQARAAQIALSGVEGMSEFVKSKLRGEENSDAIKKGLTGSGLSLILSGAAPLVEKGGKYLLSSRLNTRRFSKEVIESITRNPKELANTPKESFDEIVRSGFRAIKKMKAKAGRLVGDAKKAAGIGSAEDTVSSLTGVFSEKQLKLQKKILDKLAEAVGKLDVLKQKHRLKFIGVGESESADEVAKAAIDLVQKRGIDPFIKGGRTKNIGNVEQHLINIDSSDIFKDIFKKIDDGTSTLDQTDSIALEARRIYRDVLNETVEDIFKTSNLTQKKKQFSELKHALNLPGVEMALRSKKKMALFLKQSLKEGAVDDFLKPIRNIDNLLPEKDRFLNKFISNQAGETIDAFSSVFKGGVSGVAEGLAARAGRSLVTPSIVKKAVGAAVRRETINIGESDVGQEVIEGVVREIPSATGRVLSGVPGAARSLNDIIFRTP